MEEVTASGQFGPAADLGKRRPAVADLDHDAPGVDDAKAFVEGVQGRLRELLRPAQLLPHEGLLGDVLDRADHRAGAPSAPSTNS